ncbi:hypothetical protein IW262DRAFT_1042363 [Armillaria fumosa]|nr:hypothetical protein IW262DRAFT_1042363 [Armillaria fumosa]
MLFGIAAAMTTTTSQKSIDLTVLKARLKKKSGHDCSHPEIAGQSRNYKLYTVIMEEHDKVLVRVYWPYTADGRGSVSCTDGLYSEISTLRFLQKEDPTICAPRPVCYDDDLDGRVGGAWIATVFIEGILLSKKLAALTNVQSYLVRQSMKEIYIKILKSAGTNFNEIGSIRALGNTAATTCHHPEGSEDAKDRGFFIGPVSLSPSSETGVTAPPRSTDTGPFETGEQWLLAVTCRHLEYFGSLRRAEPTQAAVRLQCKVLEQIYEAAEIIRNRPPTDLVLEHVNFSADNILIAPDNPVKIVGVLGWAGARVVPFWGTEREGDDELVMEFERSEGTCRWDDEDLSRLAWRARNWNIVEPE